MLRRWLVERRWLVVLEVTTYKDIWAAAIREVLLCSREPTNAEKFLFQLKLHLHKIFHMFSLYKTFLQQK